MMDLVKINHAVYYGLRMSDLGNIYNNNGGNVEGLGLLLLPENYKEIMNKEQKEAIKCLLSSNKSIFGTHEKMTLKIHEAVCEEEIDKEEFNLFLEDKEEENRRKN